MTVVAIALVSTGTMLLVVSALGLLRFPDFYTRAHVVAKSETLGIMLVIAGLIVHTGFELEALRLVFVLLFAMIANPTAIHALARAARRSGLEPLTRTRR